ncbi:hypothetical protein NT239_01950 [Chitinibacter sp. SCUT-21]|uniref:hypothetical protein n=1 Tax=Chitinibacter sp. SCUT-21 TaxID=2970891 RepID=UPI0035A6D5CC
MPNSASTHHETPAVQFILRQARRLQRAAQSDSPAIALPILRRLIQAGAIEAKSLVTLYAQRQQLQRKHILRLLALEAGYPSWEKFKPQLSTLSAADLAAWQYLDTGAAQLKLWFADAQTAHSYAASQGGRVINVGQQAVVMTN